MIDETGTEVPSLIVDASIRGEPEQIDRLERDRLPDDVGRRV